MKVIFPMLIIMRVAERRAWTSNTASELQNISSIAFGQPNLPSAANGNLQGSDEDATADMSTISRGSQSSVVRTEKTLSDQNVV